MNDQKWSKVYNFDTLERELSNDTKIINLYQVVFKIEDPPPSQPRGLRQGGACGGGVAMLGVVVMVVQRRGLVELLEKALAF